MGHLTQVVVFQLTDSFGHWAFSLLLALKMTPPESPFIFPYLHSHLLFLVVVVNLSFVI